MTRSGICLIKFIWQLNSLGSSGLNKHKPTLTWAQTHQSLVFWEHLWKKNLVLTFMFEFICYKIYSILFSCVTINQSLKREKNKQVRSEKGRQRKRAFANSYIHPTVAFYFFLWTPTVEVDVNLQSVSVLPPEVITVVLSDSLCWPTLVITDHLFTNFQVQWLCWDYAPQILQIIFAYHSTLKPAWSQNVSSFAKNQIVSKTEGFYF